MSQLSQQVPQHVPQSKTYDTPGMPMWQFHMIGGGLLALIGFALMLTGGLAGIGVAVLSLGILYAGAWWVACGVLNACKHAPSDTTRASVPSDVSIR